MPPTIRARGHTWVKTDNTPTWEATVGRFRVLTWPFGPIHQCKVLVSYNEAKPTFGVVRDVGIGLAPGKTREEAMSRGLRWIERFKREGVPTAEETIARCYEDYPDLFKTRADVLDHIFFVGGNGYDWLDGGLICNDQEPAPPKRESPFVALNESLQRVLELDGLDDDFRTEIEGMMWPTEPTERPLPDDGQPREWGPVHNCTNIQLIPDDLRPDWRVVTLEAARMLRDRSTTRHHRRLGKRVIRQLQGRPWLLYAAVALWLCLIAMASCGV